MSRTIAPVDVWGVGVVDSVPWPVSTADIVDETEVAVTHLRMLGLAPGGLVLIASRLAETIHVAPIEIASGRLDARWSSTDATEGDAFRTASLIRQLRPDIVIGVNETLISALPPEAFVGLPVVATTDRVARDAITGARWWLHLGPTNAFECEVREGAHYDASRWLVESTDDGIVITNVAPRLTPARRLPTGIRGSIDARPCTCGRTNPRIVPE